MDKTNELLRGDVVCICDSRGQAPSLLFSLVVTPVIYSLLDDFKQFLARRFRRFNEFMLPDGDSRGILEPIGAHTTAVTSMEGGSLR